MKIKLSVLKTITNICTATILLIIPYEGHTRSADTLATRDGEILFGQKWLRATRARLNERVDPFCTDVLETWLTRLRNQFEIGPMPLIGLCLNSQDFNAFAAPGGIIGINRGVYLDLQTEDQIIAILAHELAHLAQRHHYRRLRQSQKLSTAKLATLVGLLTAITTQQSQAAQSLIISGQAARVNDALAYSRDFEREADRLGLMALYRSGYDPQAMVQVLSVLANKQNQTERRLSFLSTHPLGLERQSDLEARIDQLSEQELRPRLFTERDFYLFRCIQTEGLNSIPDGAYFDQCQILRNALDQYRNTRYAKALSTFLTLAEPMRNTLTGIDIQIALSINARHQESAYAAIETLELLFPSWVTPVIARVNLASAFGKQLPKQFRKTSVRRPDRLDLWRALARYAEQSKKPHLLFEARAWDALLHGKLEAAKLQIKQAEEKWPNHLGRRPLERFMKELNRAENA